MCICVLASENAAALEELLLEYETKEMAMSKGSSIKYETARAHLHNHKSSDAFAQSCCPRSHLTRWQRGSLGERKRGARQEKSACGRMYRQKWEQCRYIFIRLH